VPTRLAQARDLPALTALYNHYVANSHVTFDLELYTVESRRAWLAQFADVGPHRLLVAVDDAAPDVLLGYASSTPFRPKGGYARTVETTVYVHPDAIGRQIGRGLYTQLLDLLAAEPVHRAVAGVALPNAPSIALHTDLGFESVGTFTDVGYKHGRYIDVAWFERRLP
jgi:phosphinothricin acetyltransferase